MKSTLYLGMKKKNNDYVSKEALNRFLAEYVKPLFEGYTLTFGEGWYKEKSEPVALLTIIYPNRPFLGESQDSNRVRGICARWCQYSDQNSVLWEKQGYDYHLVYLVYPNGNGEQISP